MAFSADTGGGDAAKLAVFDAKAKAAMKATNDLVFFIGEIPVLLNETKPESLVTQRKSTYAPTFCVCGNGLMQCSFHRIVRRRTEASGADGPQDFVGGWVDDDFDVFESQCFEVLRVVITVFDVGQDEVTLGF
jgi:hypothetical protein